MHPPGQPTPAGIQTAHHRSMYTTGRQTPSHESQSILFSTQSILFSTQGIFTSLIPSMSLLIHAQEMIPAIPPIASHHHQPPPKTPKTPSPVQSPARAAICTCARDKANQRQTTKDNYPTSIERSDAKTIGFPPQHFYAGRRLRGGEVANRQGGRGVVGR